MNASSHWSRGSLAALALSVAVTCVPLVEYDGLPCPCDESGYECCHALNECLAEEDYARLCPQPMSSAGSSNGGRTSSMPTPEGGAGGVSGSAGHDGGSTAAGGVGGQSLEQGGAGGSGGASAGEGGASSPGGAGGVGGVGGEGGVPHEPCDAYSRKSNVLILAYNPLLQSENPGKYLQEHYAVDDHRALAATLAQQLTAATGGIINYHIVDQLEVNEWPPQMEGEPPLDEDAFFLEPAGGAGGGPYQPPFRKADYGAIFGDNNLCQLVNDGDISEIWLWGAYDVGGSMGFEEWKVFLPSGVPGDPSASDQQLYEERALNLPDCGRPLWVMGFTYRAGAVWAHTIFNERAGQMIGLALRSESNLPEIQLIWEHFGNWGPAHAVTSIGHPHYPPNAGVGPEGYELIAGDWDNDNDVMSDAHLWYDYPEMAGTEKLIDCRDWNCTHEGFENWYSFHIPRASGVAPGGTCNNWWRYAADPYGTLKACSGASCRPNLENGLPCASDSDCASGHCACDPEQMTAAICVAEAGLGCPSVNWSLCESDADCQSGVCGCSNGDPPPERCLPHAGYDIGCPPPPGQGGSGG